MWSNWDIALYLNEWRGRWTVLFADRDRSWNKCLWNIRLTNIDDLSWSGRERRDWSRWIHTSFLTIRNCWLSWCWEVRLTKVEYLMWDSSVWSNWDIALNLDVRTDRMWLLWSADLFAVGDRSWYKLWWIVSLADVNNLWSWANRNDRLVTNADYLSLWSWIVRLTDLDIFVTWDLTSDLNKWTSWLRWGAELLAVRDRCWNKRWWIVRLANLNDLGSWTADWLWNGLWNGLGKDFEWDSWLANWNDSTGWDINSTWWSYALFWNDRFADEIALTASSWSLLSNVDW